MPKQKTKTILKWGAIMFLAFIGFSEPTAELLPYQIIAWGVLIGIIFIKEKSNANNSKRSRI